MKNLGTHITSWLSILLCLTSSILYPFWLIDGYLDNWYLKISVFIASYGGLTASVIWYKNFVKKNK
jgi:hypothetical protein